MMMCLLVFFVLLSLSKQTKKEFLSACNIGSYVKRNGRRTKLTSDINKKNSWAGESQMSFYHPNPSKNCNILFCMQERKAR